VLFQIAPEPALKGIARLAAESPLLEGKRQVQYFEIAARSVLNPCKANMPFRWTINPYRGCEFGCQYCYARYTHEFMGMDDGRAFENRIYAKADTARILKRELLKVACAEPIAIGTATDPYQPAERRFEVTRGILEVFAAGKGRRVSITTKSDLVARDTDLLRAIASRNILHVNVSITTLSAELARLLEPRAPRPDLRLAAVKQLADAGIAVGVFAMPVLPLMTDRQESLEQLAQAARDAGAHYLCGNVLFLRPSAQKIFFPFLAERFPHLLRRYRQRYGASPYIRGAYVESLKQRLGEIRSRYGLARAPVEYQPENWDDAEPQATLFPLQ
jgi:DNA repair photolyase